MNTKCFSITWLTRGLFTSLALTISGGAAWALDSTWTGAGADSDWSTSANWDSGAPTLPSSLIFDGNQRLSNNNTWAAGSTISGLTFAPTAGNFILSGNRLALAVGGTIANLSGGAQTIAADLQLLSNQQSYTNSNNNYTTNTGNGSYLDVASGTLTISGNISGPAGSGWGGNGAGQGGWVKTGAGTLVLSGSNTYSGGSIIDGGLVIVGSTNAFGTGASIGTGNAYQLMLTSGTVDLNGYDTTIKGFHQFTSAVTGLGALGTAQISNSAANMVTLTFGGANNVYGLETTKLSGNMRVVITVKDASAIYPIRVVNDFTGGLVLANYNAANNLYTDAGVWLYGPVAALGSGAIEFNNGALRIDAGGSNTLSHNLTVSGTNKIKIQQVNLTVSGTWTGDGVMAITNGYSPVNDFQADMRGFTGTLILTAQGTHTIKLSGVNADLSAATVQLNNNRTSWDGVTTVSANAALVKFGDLNSWFGGTGALGQADAAKYADPSKERIVLNSAIGGNVTFEVGHLGKNSTFGGEIVNGSGTVAINKVGAGTWTLTGVNTYSGSTTVSGGTLLLSGTGSINGGGKVLVSDGELAVNSSVALTPQVDVNAGGKLSGSGELAGAVFFNAASAAVTGGGFGTAGTLTFSDEQYWGDFIYAWDILGAAAYDTLNFSHANGLTLTGNAYTLTVSNPSAVDFTELLVIAGAVDGFMREDWSVTAGYDLEQRADGLWLSVTPVPEPSALALLLSGAALLAFLRRRPA